MLRYVEAHELWEIQIEPIYNVMYHLHSELKRKQYVQQYTDKTYIKLNKAYILKWPW